jgi:hypothetical protein
MTDQNILANPTLENSTVDNSAAHPSNDSSSSSSKKKNSTVTMNAKGYIGEIRPYQPEGLPLVYYVLVSLLNGEDKSGNHKYLRLDLRVKKSLIPLIEKTYQSQTKVDNKSQHTHSQSLVNIEIYAPDFTSWQKDEKGGVNGEGILSNLSIGLV